MKRYAKFIGLLILGGAACEGRADDGSIVAWGANDYRQCNVPASNAGFVAVAAGEQHSLGLKSNGSIVAWGFSDAGQGSAPPSNSGFSAVAAGASHSMGLKNNGSIIAWGFNWSGQCDVPTPNSGFTAIAAGGNHSLGLKSDGSIVAWGDNNNGQGNVPSPNASFRAISAGGSHSLGLKSNGSIVAWGNNYYGQLNIPAPNSGFVAIAAGYQHSLALKTDGSIVAWGYNYFGQCNVPTPNTAFRAISAGGSHSLGLKTNGSMMAWGWNTYGQCTVPAPNTGFTAIAAGGFVRGGHSLGLKGGSSPAITGQPVDRTVCQGGSVTFSVAATGTAPLNYQWRKNSVSISGATQSTLVINPVAVADAGAYSIIVSNTYGSATSNAAALTVNSTPAITVQPQSQTVCAGGSVAFSVTATGSALSYQWQRNSVGIPGATGASYVIDPSSIGSAGNYVVLVTNSCGSVTSGQAVLRVLPKSTGDCNGDNLVNGLDIALFVVTVQRSAPVPPDLAYCAADMNGDGQVTVADMPSFMNRLLSR